jgi:hypothetical protein
MAITEWSIAIEELAVLPTAEFFPGWQQGVRPEVFRPPIGH